MSWHIRDIGTVSLHDLVPGGVRLQNVGLDLGMTADEARQLGVALIAASDASLRRV